MNLKIATIVIIVIMIAMIVFRAVAKRVIYTKLHNYIAEENYDAFFKLANGGLANVLFPDYNLNYTKLNAYLMQGDVEKVNSTLETMLQYPLSHKQRVDLVVKAFNIYIGEGNKARSREMMDEILNWEGDEYKSLKADCLRSYDIMILKKSNHIDELANLLPKTSGAVRGRLEYFIALQYENANNLEKRDEYLKLASEDGFKLMR